VGLVCDRQSSAKLATVGKGRARLELFGLEGTHGRELGSRVRRGSGASAGPVNSHRLERQRLGSHGAARLLRRSAGGMRLSCCKVASESIAAALWRCWWVDSFEVHCSHRWRGHSIVGKIDTVTRVRSNMYQLFALHCAFEIRRRSESRRLLAQFCGRLIRPCPICRAAPVGPPSSA
jgi:hypothetical protein